VAVRILRRIALMTSSAAPARRIQNTEIDEQIAGPVQVAVMEAAVAGPEQLLEFAGNALAWADNLVARFESVNTLPAPVACREGCTYCCFNQIEVTPLEALLIGHHVSRNFPAPEQTALQERLRRSLTFKAGKNKRQIAELRRKLPCPLLQHDRCAIYPVRPLVCRAMHSLDAGACAREFKSRKAPGVQYYQHRYELMLSVTAGLQDGCKALGGQSGFLDLSRALADWFSQDSPMTRWLRGEAVFRTGP
jgi:Fe-S-cluster containining protein